MDWATLGTRIIQTAAVAAAVHMAERVRMSPRVEGSQVPLDPQAEPNGAERGLG